MIASRRRFVPSPVDDDEGTFTVAFFLGPSGRGVGGIRGIVAGAEPQPTTRAHVDPGDRLRPVTWRRPTAGLPFVPS